jgi:hypothetical protein
MDTKNLTLKQSTINISEKLKPIKAEIKQSNSKEKID